MTTAADILYEAARLVATKGLAKGRYLDEEGRLCLMGAMFRAQRGSGVDKYVAENALAREFDAMAGTSMGMSQWNDLHETTSDDVIDLFKRAAKRVENGE